VTSSVLGYDTTTGQRVDLHKPTRPQGLFTLGTPGVGKSGLFERLISQDIQQDIGVCSLDIARDLTDGVLARLPDTKREEKVILFDLEDTSCPYGLNLLECTDPTNEDKVAETRSLVMHVFEKVYAISPDTPHMYEFLFNCVSTLIGNPGHTLLDIRPLLTNAAFRQTLMTHVTDAVVRDFWVRFERMAEKDQEEKSSHILNKLLDLSSPPLRNIIGQSKTTLTLQKIMDEGKFLLVKLSKKYEKASYLVGCIFVALILQAAFDRPADKRRQFHLYADEFQNFATKDFATLINEARQCGIACNLACQNLTQLDEDTRAAALGCASLIIFRVNGKDAEDVAAELDCTPPPPEIIDWRPILSPKRDVVDHLVKNGHANPGYLDGTKLLSALLLVSGVRIDSPQYEGKLGGGVEDLLANMMITSKNKAAQIQYLQDTQFITEVKAVIERLNNLFYEVMRDRDAHKPLDQKDFMILLKVTDVYAFVSRFPKIIGSLCSADLGTIHAALGHMQKDAQEGSGFSLISPPFFLSKQQRQEKVGQVAKVVLGLRKLMDILAREPIMVASGQHEPIYDKPRTYADVQHEIATRLASLPKFTARVKITVDGKPVEHTVKTLSPERGMRGIALQDRKDRIRANSRTDGYTRKRDEVEEEIRNRQNPPQAPSDTPT
jgi:hypothetical protein